MLLPEPSLAIPHCSKDKHPMKFTRTWCTFPLPVTVTAHYKLLNLGKTMSRIVGKTSFLHMSKTKPQISFAVTKKLISAFVVASRIVQSLYFLNPKSQASSHLLWLHSLVCVGPGRKPRRPVFSQRGSYAVLNYCFIELGAAGMPGEHAFDPTSARHMTGNQEFGIGEI